MQIAITGATGFIGHALCGELRNAGYAVRPLPRQPDASQLAGADAILHLAGEPVAQRWTPDAKRRIRDSRVLGTQALATALAALPHPPGVLICASATGYYGNRGDEILTETSAPGTGFLADVCREWEAAARPAEAAGIRVVHLRFGVVLGPGGGALEKMLPPFRLRLAGPLGGGRQWMSWIHRDDIIGLVRHALEHDALRGPVNATSPEPATNSFFTKELANVLHRPAVLPVPALALRLLYGEMSAVLLHSQRVLPRAAESAGFHFRHPELRRALRSILA